MSDFTKQSVIPALQDASSQLTAEDVKDILDSPNTQSPLVLFQFSKHLFENNQPLEASFWFYLAQLRARADANFIDDHDNTEKELERLTYEYGPRINRFMFQRPDQLEEMIERVVEWDETTPCDYSLKWLDTAYDNIERDPPGVRKDTRNQFLAESTKFIDESKQKIKEQQSNPAFTILALTSSTNIGDYENAFRFLTKEAQTFFVGIEIAQIIFEIENDNRHDSAKLIPKFSQFLEQYKISIQDVRSKTDKENIWQSGVEIGKSIASPSRTFDEIAHWKKCNMDNRTVLSTFSDLKFLETSDSEALGVVVATGLKVRLKTINGKWFVSSVEPD